MGQLTNLFVSESYQGLIKLANSTTGVTENLQYLQDGLGNNLPIQVSSTEVTITGSISNAVSSSYAQNATSASQAENSNKLDGKDSTEFAITGSNTFLGDQIINGTLSVTGQTTLSGLDYPTVDGLPLQYLQTDGSGSLTFAEASVTAVSEVMRNGEATQITKGTPVYVSGSNGAVPMVYRADASDPNKMPAIYIANANINPNQNGSGLLTGLINGVDTTGFPAGTDIFVAPGGGYTATRPTGSAIIQFLGTVTKEGNGGAGVILNPGQALLPNLASDNLWLGNIDGVPTQVDKDTLGFATTSSLTSLSSSIAVTDLAQNGRLSSLETNSGSQQLEINQKLDSSSFNSYTSSNNSRVSSLESKTGSYATTGSNIFQGTQTVTGSLNVTGEITALSASITYLKTIYQTSSIVYSSGSNILGDEASDVQTFWGKIEIPSGPVNITGSLNVTGNITGNLIGNASTATSASQAQNSVSSSEALHSVSSSHSTYSETAGNSNTAVSSSEAQHAVSSSYSLFSETSVSSSEAQHAVSASYAPSNPLPSGLVSGSSQISYTGITDVPSGIVSGSSQISDLGYAITGSNTFVGNQIVTGSITTNNIITATKINLTGGSGTDLIVTGSGTISNNLIVGPEGGNSGYISEYAISSFNQSTFDELGFTNDGATYGISGWNGPTIYGNDPDDTYPAFIGFQNKTDWTDGRVTVLKPLYVNDDTNVDGSITSKRLYFNGNPFNTDSSGTFGSINYDATNTSLSIINNDFSTPVTKSAVYVTTNTGSNLTNVSMVSDYAGTSAELKVQNSNGTRNVNVQTDTMTVTGSLSVSNGVTGSFRGDGSGLTGITATLPSGVVSGSAQVSAFGFAITGSNTFIGNQIINGSSTQNIGTPGVDSQTDFITVSGSTIEGKQYNYVNSGFVNYPGYGIGYADTFLIEYYSSLGYEYGAELQVNGRKVGANLYASGSGQAAAFSLRDVGDETTSFNVYADDIQIGEYAPGTTTRVGIGHSTLPLLKIEGSLINISGSTHMYSSDGFPLYVDGTMNSKRLHFTGNPFNTDVAPNLGALRFDGTNTQFYLTNYDNTDLTTQSIVGTVVQTGSNHVQTFLGANNNGTNTYLRLTNDAGVGSLTTNVDMVITGSLTATGTINGTFVGDGSGLTGVISTVPSGTISGSAQIAALGYAITGSNSFVGNQTITGSIFITDGVNSGSVITNQTDVQTLPKVNNIVTLTQAEYNTLATGSALNDNTLYVVSGSVPSPFPFTGDVVITGSVSGNVNPLSITSLTASMDTNTANFFTLSLPNAATHILPTNIKPGQTINVRVIGNLTSTVTFPSSVKQPSGSLYVPTVSGTDILTFVSFDGTDIYMANVKKLI